MNDYISRRMAIEVCKEVYNNKLLSADGNIGAQMCADKIFGLSSVQPERKTGHWIYGEDDGQDGWYCSECNGFVPWDYEYYGLENIDFIDDFKVCPFCEADMVSRTGADMRGEQDE